MAPPRRRANMDSSRSDPPEPEMDMFELIYCRDDINMRNGVGAPYCKETKTAKPPSFIRRSAPKLLILLLIAALIYIANMLTEP